jgi:hypothetical protein
MKIKRAQILASIGAVSSMSFATHVVAGEPARTVFDFREPDVAPGIASRQHRRDGPRFRWAVPDHR